MARGLGVSFTAPPETWLLSCKAKPGVKLSLCMLEFYFVSGWGVGGWGMDDMQISFMQTKPNRWPSPRKILAASVWGKGQAGDESFGVSRNNALGATGA